MAYNKISCMLIACVVCLLAQPVSLGNNGANKTVRIGVRVNIPEMVHSEWSDRQLQSVRKVAIEQLLVVVSDNFIHWNFYDCGTENPPVLLTLDIVEEETNQLVVKLQIRILKKTGFSSSDVKYRSVVLAKDIWYEPADMLAGPPGPSQADNKLDEFIRLTFPDDEDDREIKLYVDKLLRNVPLATGPRWIEPRNKSFILPLSKARYAHLLWSRFLLCSRSGNPDQAWVRAKANDIWDNYDQTITEALIADIEEGSPPFDPNTYDPALVYLSEYIEDVGWDVF